MTLFLKVSELVFNRHTDHFDFCDDSCILHIMNVVNRIPKEYRTEDIEILALLHDTIWYHANKKEKYDSIFTKHKEKYQKIQDISDRYGEEIDKAILEYTKKESEYKKYYEMHDKAFFETVPIIPMNLFEKLFSMDNPELKPLWNDVVVQLEKTLNMKIEFINIDVTFLNDKVKNGSEMSTVLTLNTEKVASLHMHVAMINHYLYVRMSHVLYDLLNTSEEFQSTWNKCMTILKLLEPDFFNS